MSRQVLIGQLTDGDRLDPLDHEQGVGLTETLLAFPVQELTTMLVLAALQTRARCGDLTPRRAPG